MFGILIKLFMNLILILGLAWYGCFACFKVHVNSCLNRYKRDCSKVYVKENGEKECKYEEPGQTPVCCGYLIKYCEDPEGVEDLISCTSW